MNFFERNPGNPYSVGCIKNYHKKRSGVKEVVVGDTVVGGWRPMPVIMMGGWEPKDLWNFVGCGSRPKRSMTYGPWQLGGGGREGGAEREKKFFGGDRCWDFFSLPGKNLAEMHHTSWLICIKTRRVRGNCFYSAENKSPSVTALGFSRTGNKKVF